MRKNLFIFIFFLVLLIASLNELGHNFFLYWRLWWYDILLHFLGGLWVALSALWVYLFSGYLGNLKRDWETLLIVSILSTFIVGVGWEVFEFLIEVEFSNNYIGDTTLDMIMDLTGALVAGFSVIFFNRKNLKKLTNKS